MGGPPGDPGAQRMSHQNTRMFQQTACICAWCVCVFACEYVCSGMLSPSLWNLFIVTLVHACADAYYVLLVFPECFATWYLEHFYFRACLCRSLLCLARIRASFSVLTILTATAPDAADDGSCARLSASHEMRE